jgi:predicted LPLAT superfamily acyltransferase
LERDQAASVAPHWTERPEGGGWFAIWLIRTIGLKLGRGAARSILYPITLYFYLRRPFERRMSSRFLARVFGRPATMIEVMRHIHRFASTILDRVFLLAESFSRFDVRIHGLDELTTRARRGRGVLLLGSHVGSFEVLRVAATRTPDIRVCVVFDQQQARALTQLLNAINPGIARNVIDASGDGMDIVLAMADAIADGKVAALLADRARPHERTAVVNFLGAPAAFPVAPFRMGALLGCPIVLCFGMYRGGNRYDLFFELFDEHLQLPRRGADAETRDVVQRYVARIEHYVKDDPYNWFNWFDVWDVAAAGGQAFAGTDRAQACLQDSVAATISRGSA